MKYDDPREDIVWRLRTILKAQDIDREEAYQILISFDKGVELGQDKMELYKVADEAISKYEPQEEK